VLRFQLFQGFWIGPFVLDSRLELLDSHQQDLAVPPFRSGTVSIRYGAAWSLMLAPEELHVDCGRCP
jgi:hypothetical protein